MFEILIDVTDSVAKPKPAASGSVRTTPVHQSFRTHILAASDYSLFKEQDGFPSKRRRQLSLPSSCFQSVLRPIGEANLIVVFFAVNRVLRIFSGLSKPRLSSTYSIAGTKVIGKPPTKLSSVFAKRSGTNSTRTHLAKFVPAGCKVLQSNVRQRNHSLLPFTHRSRFRAEGR